ncbi:hypothetical protein IFM89_017563, partial [Coptis chinensis]
RAVFNFRPEFISLLIMFHFGMLLYRLKSATKFWIHTTNKYRFTDQVTTLIFLNDMFLTLGQGSNLRGKEFNLTLHWHVMPKTGKMFADKIVMSGYLLTEKYFYLTEHRSTEHRSIAEKKLQNGEIL